MEPGEPDITDECVGQPSGSGVQERQHHLQDQGCTGQAEEPAAASDYRRPPGNRWTATAGCTER